MLPFVLIFVEFFTRAPAQCPHYPYPQLVYCTRTSHLQGPFSD
uniref:Uncharacterized protein n=1 Tax=Arundo donax TaxID=35708 RepID=A0A0A9GPE9_ARUDO